MIPTTRRRLAPDVAGRKETKPPGNVEALSGVIAPIARHTLVYTIEKENARMVKMPIITCLFCNKQFEAKRKTRKYCSELCASRTRTNFPKERTCQECGKVFQVETRADAARKYCSQQCTKRHHTKSTKGWVEDHAGINKVYAKNRVIKDPLAWKKHANKQRQLILDLLGGQCIVCNATNPNWLHVDYIPTTRGVPHRHPRHFAYISKHKNDFRLLCANHHYELTLTGAIEGTDITQ